MRNFFYALVFISLAVFGFSYTLKSSAAEISGQPIVNNYPYQIIEIKPLGGEVKFNGVSSNIDPVKIIPDLNVPYYPEDKISTLPDPKVGIGGIITINRAPVIKIKDGKKIKDVRSWVKTVGELLSEKNIELGTDDKISPTIDTQITDGSNIVITRVAITTLIETKPIDFQIQNKDDPNLDYGKKRVEAGEKGEKKLTYRVTREDGEEVGRVLLDSQVVKQPKTQINFTGTKVTVLSSVSGRATMTPVSGYVVSPNYRRGILIRITNKANGISIFQTVNATWGSASPPDGVVLDLAPSFLAQLKCPSHGCSSVLVEEIKQ